MTLVWSFGIRLTRSPIFCASSITASSSSLGFSYFFADNPSSTFCSEASWGADVVIIGLVVVRCAFGSTPWPDVGIGIIAVVVRADLDSSRDTGEDRRGVEYGIEEGSWVLCSLY